MRGHQTKQTTMKKLIYILTIFLLVSCGTTTTENSTSNIPADISFEIINEEKDDAISKCNLDIRLNKKVDETTLTNIANELRASRTQYNKLWIGYFLPDMTPGKGAWATTHFTPDLKVEIIGSQENQDKVMLDSANADGEIYGRWKDVRPMAECIFVIFKDQSKKTQMKKVLTDGSSYLTEMKSSNNNTKFVSKEDVHGEYFVIETNGNLGMYSPDGKFGECENVDKK